MKRYKIFQAKYQLSDELCAIQSDDSYTYKGTSVHSDPVKFHIEIYRDRKRVAFFTQNSYKEAKEFAEEYCR